MSFESQKKLISGVLILLPLAFALSCEGGETHRTELYQQLNTNPSVPIMDMMVVDLVDQMLPQDSMPPADIGEDQEIEVNCGINAEENVVLFSEGPLHIISANCAQSGCHNDESFRQFKLSFHETDPNYVFSEMQIQEGLEAVEPLVIPGNGVMSRLAQRMIDSHSDLSFNADSAEYQDVVAWINQINPCQ